MRAGHGPLAQMAQMAQPVVEMLQGWQAQVGVAETCGLAAMSARARVKNAMGWV